MIKSLYSSKRSSGNSSGYENTAFQKSIFDKICTSKIFLNLIKVFAPNHSLSVILFLTSKYIKKATAWVGVVGESITRTKDSSKL